MSKTYLEQGHGAHCSLDTGNQPRHHKTSVSALRAAAAFLIYARGPEQSHEMKDADEQFKALDSDGDGKLSKADIEQAFAMFEESSRNLQVTAGALVNMLDFTGDGHVHYSEFLAGSSEGGLF